MKKRVQYLPLKAALALFTIGLFSIVGCYPGEAQLAPQAGASNATSPGESGNAPVFDRIKTAVPPTATAVPTPLPQPVKPEPTEPIVEIDPLSDPDSILVTINQFAALEQSALIGQPGWIHTRYIEVVSLSHNDGDFRDVNTSMPTSQLIPESPISDSWFHVDETGIYHEGLGLVTSTDGRIYQHTVLFDGHWTNVTLKENGFTHHSMLQNPQLINLPTANIATQLQEIHKSPVVTLSAQINDGLYILTWEYEYQEPIEIMPPSLPGLVTRDKQILTFDPETGRLLSHDLYYYLEDGTGIQAIGSTIEAEFLAELPPDKAPLFYDTVAALQNE